MKWIGMIALLELLLSPRHPNHTHTHTGDGKGKEREKAKHSTTTKHTSHYLIGNVYEFITPLPITPTQLRLKGHPTNTNSENGSTVTLPIHFTHTHTIHKHPYNHYFNISLPSQHPRPTYAFFFFFVRCRAAFISLQRHTDLRHYLVTFSRYHGNNEQSSLLPASRFHIAPPQPESKTVPQPSTNPPFAPQ